MIREVQTRWIVGPSYDKATEFAVKRAKNLATTYAKGLEMLDKAHKRGAVTWKLFEVRFVIEVTEVLGSM